MANKGRVFLIPTIIADDTQHKVITQQCRDILPSIRHFLAEDVRTARRFLSSLKIYDSIEALDFKILNKGSKEADLPELLAPVHDGHDLGVVSESGCPGVADPGAIAVNYCHKHGILVTPLVGPSSLLLALMASGLNGQKFAFHGYLPIDSKDLSRTIRSLEEESRKSGQTQMFIETPYRNNQVFKALINSLGRDTELCVATDITGKEESIRMRYVRDWRLQSVEIPKKPTVYLFLAK